MDKLSLWIVILGGMVATFTIRLMFFVLIPEDRLPQILRRSLRYVPPAVLSALLLPEIVQPAGSLDLSLGNYHLLAGVVAALVAWRTRNTWLTILTGMVTLALLSQFAA
jgi:branched-subunit amino acid transport protein